MTAIDDAVLNALIAQGETASVEFKSSLRWDVRLQRENDQLRLEIPKSVAAFANADGGTLVIGVTGAGERLGLANDMQLNRRNPTTDGLQITVATLLRTTIGGAAAGRVGFHVAGTQIDPILVLEMDRSPSPVFVAADNHVSFFVRIGTTSVELDVAEAVRYVLEHWPGLDRI